MRKLICVAVMALIVLMGQLFIAGAMATVTYDPCEVGDHVYELEETKEWGIGFPRPFTVPGCENSSEAHKHYLYYGTTEYVYVCTYCGNKESYYQEYVVTEMGETCELIGDAR